MYNINDRISELRKSGLFTLEQIRVIEYASFIPEIDVDLIINPTIPSEYMSMYVKLMIKGIDVTKYIKNNWRLIEIPVNDLYSAIVAENKDLINNKQKVRKK